MPQKSAKIKAAESRIQNHINDSSVNNDIQVKQETNLQMTRITQNVSHLPLQRKEEYSQSIDSTWSLITIRSRNDHFNYLENNSKNQRDGI